MAYNNNNNANGRGSNRNASGANRGGYRQGGERRTDSRQGGQGSGGGHRNHQNEGSVVGFRDGQPIYRKGGQGQNRPNQGGARYESRGEQNTSGRYPREEGAQGRGGNRNRPDNRYSPKGGAGSAVEYPFKTREEQENASPRTQERPHGGRQQQDSRPYGAKQQSYGGRQQQDSRPYGAKQQSYGGRQQQDSRPYGAKERPYGDRQQQDSRPYGAKQQPYGDRQQQDSRPYGVKQQSYGARQQQDSRPYGAKQQPYGDRQQDSRPYGAREEAEQAARTDAPTREDELPYLVMGRNAVREALKSGRSIDRILVVKEQDGSLREILSLARDHNVQIREVTKAKLDELCMPFGHGGKSGNHQGIVAQVPGVEYCEISDILDVAKERGEKPFVILLDGIEDPYNLGSIIRSAECSGAHGVIIPRRRSASVTAAASKASAGAVEYMKVARVSNLSGAIARLKDAGLWIVGADMQGQPMSEGNLSGAIGLVIGSESSGISKLVKDNCDFLASIPMKGKLDSLNASVAAAVLMFEKGRQDAK